MSDICTHSNSDDDNLESFYNDLESTLKSLRNHEMVFVLGAKVGQTEKDKHLRHVLLNSVLVPETKEENVCCNFVLDFFFQNASITNF